MKRETEARTEAERLYPIANQDDYPDNPDVNRLNRSCQSAFMNGTRFNARSLGCGLRWRDAKEFPNGNKPCPIKLKDGSYAAGFYTKGGEVDSHFEEDYGYEDKNGYLTKGWYRTYDSVSDSMFYIVPADVTEYLSESETTDNREWPTESEIDIAYQKWLKETGYDPTHQVSWKAAISWLRTQIK